MTEKPEAIAAMSGGVDSTVAAVLAREDYDIIPVIIDTGFMRTGEVEWVRKALQKVGFEFPWVWNAGEWFIEAIGKETDAEKKRALFKSAYFGCLAEACKTMHVKYLIQGTIAPDWIESQGGIKTHHNVTAEVGIDPIKEYGIEIVEPIRELYKDQVRLQAEKLGLPEEIITRQPFPGPGLMLRLVGHRVQYGRLETLRECTTIVESALKDYGFGQCFCAFVADDAKVTGVKGDERAYGNFGLVEFDRPGMWPDYVRGFTSDPDITRVFMRLNEKLETVGYDTVIRAVTTRDFMTADVGLIPEDVLKKLCKDLQAVKEVGNVYYDITPKPPGTVEFE